MQGGEECKRGREEESKREMNARMRDVNNAKELKRIREGRKRNARRI